MKIMRIVTSALFMGLATLSWADNNTDIQLIDDLKASCGDKIKADGVLVLDLAPYAQQQRAAAEFVQRQIKEFQLVTPIPVLIPNVLPDERNHRKTVIKQSQYEAAARGCNLVLVQAVEILNSEYPTIHVAHDGEPVGIGRTDYKARVNLGYALVLMGTKTD